MIHFHSLFPAKPSRRFSLMLFLLLAGMLPAASGATLRVLFIGNSYTFTNDLPAMLEQLATAGGDRLEYNSSAPGGYTLERHSTFKPTLDLIMAGNWDYIVLQEQSQRPAFPEAQVNAEVYPYARKLDSLVKVYNPCARTVFFMTWGYKYGDAGNCPIFPPLCSYNSMDSMIRLRYTVMSERNKALLCPVGRTWNRLIRTAGPDLYSPDNSHPSVAGTYAAACSFYASLFGKDPLKNPYSPALPITDARLIREAASAVVYDSLPHWSRFIPPFHADFSYTVTGAKISFSNSSSGSTTYAWDFGDGNSATDKDPDHSYGANGRYTVRLIISDACGRTDTAIQHIDITTVGLQEVQAAAWTVFPNPCTEVLQISSGSTILTDAYRIRDLQGRLLLQQQYTPAASVLCPVESLPPGFYLLDIDAGNRTYRTRFCKK